MSVVLNLSFKLFRLFLFLNYFDFFFLKITLFKFLLVKFIDDILWL